MCQAPPLSAWFTSKTHGAVLEFKSQGIQRKCAMPNVLIHKANELKPETRAAVEAELGRSLDDDEDVSIMAFSTHDSPAGEAHIEAGQRLEAHFKRIDSQTARVPDKVAEAALSEALKKVRPGYRERE